MQEGCMAEIETITKTKLTDRFILALPPAPEGRRRTVWDETEPGLAIVVTDTGHKSFKVVKRIRGGAPVKLTLKPAYPVMTLALARERARAYKIELASGINPRQRERGEDEERRRREEEEKNRVTFALAAEVYIKKGIIGEDPDDPELRTADTLEKQIRRDLLSRPWSKKAITAITKDDILQTIREIKNDPERSKPGKRSNAAATAFGHTSRILAWALKRDYGLEHNVADRIDLDEEVGKPGKSRDRVLSDHEIRLFWKATGKMGYPGGSMLRLLFLSACRLREIAKAERSEFEDVDGAESIGGKLLTVPARRMKGRKRAAVEHGVPIVPLMEEVLSEVPKFAGGGKFVFSKNGGRTPSCNFSLLKTELVEAVEQVQRDDLGLPASAPIPDEHRVPHFTLHDFEKNHAQLAVSREDSTRYCGAGDCAQDRGRQGDLRPLQLFGREARRLGAWRGVSRPHPGQRRQRVRARGSASGLGLILNPEHGDSGIPLE
jgi:integrase